ncbi:MAG: carbohydrate ABC transporter permease [Firmicutes bacterium]|nr:carbohydrate ABC transporter permease [Bacillota bacterium]
MERTIITEKTRTNTGEGREPSIRRRSLAQEVCLQIVLALGGVAIVAPFLYMLSTSLKTQGQWVIAPMAWIPNPITVENYINAFRAVNVFLLAKNSLIIVVFSLVGQVLSCAAVAYPLARLRFPGRQFVFVLVIATLMLPPQVLLIPQYLIFNRLGWVDTFRPFIVPSYFGLNAFFVFLLRQFFRTIPRELDEAVLLDGGSYFTIFWRVVLPLAKPALVTVAIFHVAGTYNDFFGPLVYLHSWEKYTMTIGIVLLGALINPNLPAVPIQTAGAVLMIVPLVVFYFLVQEQFTRGIQLSGMLKG